MPRAFRESATANGIAPPAAIRPTGDVICKALSVMASSSMRAAVVGRKTERAVLGVADKGEDFGDRGILSRHRLRLDQSFGEDTGAVKQLLIERSHGCKPFPGELAALHADDVEPFKACILAVDEAERNHVAAHAADPADHHLRPYPGELMHCRQSADEDEVADLAMAAEGRRGRENHIIADLAVMPDMAAIHEIAALANPRDAAAGQRAGVHGDGFADGAAGTDLKLGELAAIAQRLRRRAQ